MEIWSYLNKHFNFKNLNIVTTCMMKPGNISTMKLIFNHGMWQPMPGAQHQKGLGQTAFVCSFHHSVNHH